MSKIKTETVRITWQPRFVQIAVDSSEEGRVYALDEVGRVWSWHIEHQRWEWFPDEREPLP